MTDRYIAMRRRASQLTEERIGDGIICHRCHATFATFADKCTADLAERCPGFERIDVVKMQAEHEVGLT